MSDAPEWLSYREGAARFGLSPEAFRQRAKRLRLPMMTANDGRKVVQVPPGLILEAKRRGDHQGDKTGHEQAGDRAGGRSTVQALEDHVTTLRQQLARTEAEADRCRAEHQAERARLLADLAQLTAPLDQLRLLTAERDRLQADLGRAHAAHQAERDRLLHLLEQALRQREVPVLGRLRRWLGGAKAD